MTKTILLICVALISGSANASDTQRLQGSAVEQEEKHAAIDDRYLDLTMEVDKQVMKQVQQQVMAERGP
jgi:hypothetical protein